MQQAYFACGFNGFGQLNSLCDEEWLVKGNAHFRKEHQDSMKNEAMKVTNVNESSSVKISNIRQLKNNAAITLPIRMDLKGNCSCTWSGICVYDNVGNQMAEFGFSSTTVEGIKSGEHLKKCFPSIDNVLEKETLVKFEQEDCPRSFDPLPLGSMWNIFKDVAKKKAFAVAENGQTFEMIESPADQEACLNKSYEVSFHLEQYKISNDVEITSVSCGKEHTLLLSSAGKVYSFGAGSRGQLGIGSLENKKNPCFVEALQIVEVAEISAGGWHSLARSASGDLYSWGWNESGQLGLGCEYESDIDNPATSKIHCNEDKPCKRPMFSYLPHLIEFDNDAEVCAISSGSRHSAAVTGRFIFTWGWNGYGQLGHGHRLDCHYPKKMEFDWRQVRATEVLCYAWNTMIRFTTEEPS